MSLGVFAMPLMSNLHTFDQRAQECIFVGYPPSQKVYRVYDLVTKQFFSSRDDIFHEDMFPFSVVPQDARSNSHLFTFPCS